MKTVAMFAALFVILGMAAIAECVVYNAACRAGVNWQCYRE
jgi:hypothetical protein